VLVSEFMLQQTQVDRVVPRFLAFMERFPTLEALAQAPEQEVLAAWSSLGYYRRARLLHRAARAVQTQGGTLPGALDQLQQLPGIGPYTAAAVASLAFGQALPVVDGNVLRIGARQLALPDDPRRAAPGAVLRQWVQSLLDGHDAPGEVNEALMELGATVCLPRQPLCTQCPLADSCRGWQQGKPEAYPPPRAVRTPEEHSWVAACCIDDKSQWLLRRVDEGPLLRGLWLPPLHREEGAPAIERAQACLGVGGKLQGEVLPPVRHSITYRRLSVTPVRFHLAQPDTPSDAWAWCPPHDPGLPTSSLLAKLVKKVSSAEQGRVSS
jgi:A/G-specific adenine glycosylase